MSEISPLPFVEATLAYQKTAAVKAAVGLDLFTHVSDGAVDIDTLAGRTGASPRGLRILCDFLTVHGFVEKSERGYAATPSTRVFLDRRSPNYLGSIIEFHAAPQMCSLFLSDPVAYVRNGGSVDSGSVAPDHALWRTFAESMEQTMTPIATAIAKDVASWPVKLANILDVAAGHGVFGLAIAKTLPGAQVTAIDWADVLSRARDNAERAGLGASFHTIAGDAFAVDWGSGYDLVLLANFLHHFDQDACIGLLAKAKASLTPGGKVIAVEFVPNEDRVSPPFQAAFAFYMLGSTPRGDAFTAGDLERMGRAAGFSSMSVKPLPRSVESLVLFGQ